MRPLSYICSGYYNFTNDDNDITQRREYCLLVTALNFFFSGKENFITCFDSYKKQKFAR